jgi:hypothetical protein
VVGYWPIIMNEEFGYCSLMPASASTLGDHYSIPYKACIRVLLLMQRNK